MARPSVVAESHVGNEWVTRSRGGAGKLGHSWTLGEGHWGATDGSEGGRGRNGRSIGVRG